MNIKLKVWTVTTDGDNCPITTTVHVTKAAACRRVRDDLANRFTSAELDAAGDDLERLASMWEVTNDGACAIEEHTVE